MTAEVLFQFRCPFPAVPSAILGSFESVADEIATLESGRNLRVVARYVLGVGLGILVLILLFGRRSEFTAAWRQLSEVAA
jgi:hypothetical protein